MIERSTVAMVIASAADIERLTKTLLSVAAQDRLPDEIVICRRELTHEVTLQIEVCASSLGPRVIVVDAIKHGAAPQRQQAFEISTADFVLFIDDDVDLEPGCIANLEQALSENPALGGVCACIRNQNYRPPGRVYRQLLRAVGFPAQGTLSGLCRGPIVHFLPDLTVATPVLQRMEWLNLTCTMYRRSVLPRVLFEGIVGEYALMEDVALSLKVAHEFDLAACRHSVIFHDTQSQDYKSNAKRRQMMEVNNRVYIMKNILKDFGARRQLQLLLLSLLFTLTIWRVPGRWLPKLQHVVARWRYHIGLYVPRT